MILDNKCKIILFFILISFLPIFSVNAEELTLKDFAENALRDNYDLRVSRKTVLKAEGQKLEMWGNLFPQISARYNYTYVNKDMEIIISEDFSIPMGQKDMYEARLSFRQPVYTFGTIKNSYLISKDALDIEIRRQKQLKNKVISNVRKTYYRVLLMMNAVDIVKMQKSLMKENLKITKNLYNNGKASSLDVSRVKMHLARAESSLIDAESNLQLARENLFSISQINDRQQKIAGELEYHKFNYNLDELIDTALKNRQEIYIADLAIDINKKKKWIVYAENLPKIYAFAGYTYEKPYLNENKWGNYWSVGGTIEFPFFDGLSFYGRDKKSKAALEEAAIQKEKIKEAVKLEVEKNYYVLQQAEKKIKVQKENLSLAEENLNVSSKRYANGLLSNLELNQSIFDYTSSRMELANSIFRFLASLEDLKVAAGKEINR